MSRISQGSDEDYKLVCLPCHRDEETRPAFGYCTDCHEHLCTNCYKHHKKPIPLRHHRLLHKDAMPSTQRLTESFVHVGSTYSLSTPCPHHKKEKIKLYCHDCELLLCGICEALEHKAPCHVDYIPEISNKMVNSPDYKQIMERMDKVLKKCTTIVTDTKKSKDSLKEASQEIEKYRTDMNKRLDELQKELQVMVQSLQHQNDEQIKTVTAICEDATKMLKETYDNMKQLNTSKQADQLFIEVKQAQAQLQDYEQSIASLSTEYCMDEYKFVQNQAINDVLRKEKMIGGVFTKHGTREASAPKCLGEICVNSSKDMMICEISGMTVLPPDRLVLADCINVSIKLVDVNSKSITSQLTLGTELEDLPWDITSTTSTQVAVTVPDRQHIQFISVSDKLSKTHTIKTDGKCGGICCHEDKLVVTYCNPGKLEILDMKGRVITRVRTDSTGKDVFNQPRYVQANSSSIYVLDEGLKDIIILNRNGKITGKIADIEHPWGLALLGDGRLLVSDDTGNRVYQVSGCTTRRIVLLDVKCPHAVCVDDGGHKLYISRLALQEDKLHNNILVYDM